jgi:hypothetical protein
VTFGVAEISVSFNHGGGGEWWGVWEFVTAGFKAFSLANGK